MSDDTEYRINISVEPYNGELGQVSNTFSFELAEIIASLLEKKREKLALFVGGLMAGHVACIN